MNRSVLTPLVVAAVLGLSALHAQTFTLTPSAGFGGGDGWLAPREGGISYLDTGNNERGLAYNRTTDNLILVSRSGGLNIRVLDGATGASEGTLSQGPGVITGGTIAASMVGVAGDGAIYVGNLTTGSATSPFKLYRWENEAAAAPSLVFSGNPHPTGSARFGDTLDVTGAENATRVVIGAGSTPAGFNSYSVINPVAGTAGYVTYTTPAPSNGDFRLGITFLDNDSVMGTQGGTWRVTDFAGTAGTLVGSKTTSSASERAMDYAVIGGRGYLATIDSASSRVRVYNMDDPTAPALIAEANNTTGTLASNGNGTGSVAWGKIGDATATLYAMNSNQGIQAFDFTVVPEPEEYALLAAAGLVGFGVWRRLRR
ncbi:MAG: PEP-CTERM sorting domain-containing protein [Verrucomicrobiota bacterium]